MALPPHTNWSTPPPPPIPMYLPLLPHTVLLVYRNGVLIDHYLTEVNGQNVIGLKDKAIAEVFSESPRTLTITFMPAFVYDHMMQK